ncbi:GNAT family N-acetyltransferase [Blastococcus sp. MG754426]|uniref:GNAT family N-acetyltransferase n=1 Tax=unclassified Blastococcus TaxID=2619396 RepID=UPI001EF0F21C|nr:MULTISPECIES: GNAT family N-acetyltransferase [unclassified Blastococcus]MCF6506170.1 GNAT family N-acetyltransferase [Blastococcus sp. MG754426]MCF6510452.1 GNAT family N-acetyltransferase [Blastococcus sp. MG754427]MCF6735584.1 GNAT family N-acetyltransferase [Blastococcus sp. KM273129]
MPPLRWLTAPDQVSPSLRADLVSCWRDVVNGGGAVGFARQVPVDDDVVAPVVDRLGSGLDPRLRRLLVALSDGGVAGWLVLTGNADPVAAHWARVTHVQTSPAARGSGVGGALMGEVARAARDDLGLDALRLEVRGGMGLESFYGRHGWTVTGCWPGALQIGVDDRRDEVLMGLDLRAR